MTSRSLIIVLALAGCATAPQGNPSVARAIQTTGTCPSPDPVRDGPLADAIRADDATIVEAALARDVQDSRARAAYLLISGQGVLNEDEAACFTPYLL